MQKSKHREPLLFCKRCFTSFDNQKYKKISGQTALEEHKLIYGTCKPSLPIMPEKGTLLKFKRKSKTQRHPLVIYLDFKELLIKILENKSYNTRHFQKYKPMSYGFIVEDTENVSIELLVKFNIPQNPIIFHGCESKQDVARKFVNEITEIARGIFSIYLK